MCSGLSLACGRWQSGTNPHERRATWSDHCWLADPIGTARGDVLVSGGRVDKFCPGFGARTGEGSRSGEAGVSEVEPRPERLAS